MKIVSLIQDTTIECAPFSWGISLFSFGCNLHCKMCEGYNYEKVTDSRNITGTAIQLIEENITPLHDCVVFIGGEPTIWEDKLKEALEYCHNKNLKTKIFTNGMLPEVVEDINNKRLCDAWSVDYKGIPENIAPFICTTAEEYKTNINRTLNSIIKNNIPLEIRTTLYNDNMEDKEAIKETCNNYIKEGKACNGEDYFIKWIEQYDIRKYV